MTAKKPSRGVACHYCHISGHVRQDCRKLQNINRRFQCAHESLKDVSTPSTMLVESGKPKVKNIGFDGYIGTWILRIYRIYRRYIGGYF